MVTEPSEFIQRLKDIQENGESTVLTTLPSDEPRFVIDADTRIINIPDEFTFLSVKNDHKAETIYFEIDRYFDDVDLSEYTCVVQFSHDKNTNEGGISPVTAIDTTTLDGKLIMGWKIANDATRMSGDIYFAVRFYSVDDNNRFTYNFNTAPAKSVILDTLDIDDTYIVESYPSTIQAIMDMLKGGEKVSKAGDSMTGDLLMKNGTKIKIGEAIAGEETGSVYYDTSNKQTVVSSKNIKLHSTDPIDIESNIRLGTPSILTESNEITLPEKDGTVVLVEDMENYTKEKIAELVNGAPETMDTLKEISDAIAEHKDVEKALNEAIGKKVSKAGDSMTGDLLMKNGTKIKIGEAIAGEETGSVYYDTSNKQTVVSSKNIKLHSTDPIDIESNIRLGTPSILTESNEITLPEKDGTVVLVEDMENYTKEKIAELVNGAPETMDTLKEISDAIAEHKDVEKALNEAIGKKANQSDLSSHENASNPHNITKSVIGLGKVENKSSEDIRGELTSENVTNALGYTPGTSSSKPITYTLSKDGATISLTSSEGVSSSVTLESMDSEQVGINKEDISNLKKQVESKLGKTEQASDSATVNGHTVNKDVPSDAKFTDTWRPQPDWNATSGDAVIKNKPSIPSEVKESTVSGWGFTKNKGTYSKPSGGIPKTDLSAEVQANIGKTLTSTLTAGNTSVVITDSAITTSSTVDFYTDVYGVNPTDAKVESGKITLTFKAQSKAINVKVVVK